MVNSNVNVLTAWSKHITEPNMYAKSLARYLENKAFILKRVVANALYVAEDGLEIARQDSEFNEFMYNHSYTCLKVRPSYVITSAVENGLEVLTRAATSHSYYVDMESLFEALDNYSKRTDKLNPNMVIYLSDSRRRMTVKEFLVNNGIMSNHDEVGPDGINFVNVSSSNLIIIYSDNERRLIGPSDEISISRDELDLMILVGDITHCGIEVNFFDLIESITSSFSQQRGVSSVLDSLASNPNTSKADLITSIKEVVGINQYDKAVETYNTLTNIASDAKIQVDDRLSAISELLSEGIISIKQSIGSSDDSVNVTELANNVSFDDQTGFIVDINDYSGASYADMWDGSNLVSIFKGAILTAVTVVVAGYRLIATAVGGLLKVSSRLWRKYVTPLYYTKDFVKTEHDEHDGYVDVPLISWINCKISEGKYVNDLIDGMIGNLDVVHPLNIHAEFNHQGMNKVPHVKFNAEAMQYWINTHNNIKDARVSRQDRFIENFGLDDYGKHYAKIHAGGEVRQISLTDLRQHIANSVNGVDVALEVDFKSAADWNFNSTGSREYCFSNPNPITPVPSSHTKVNYMFTDYRGSSLSIDMSEFNSYGSVMNVESVEFVWDEPELIGEHTVGINLYLRVNLGGSMAGLYKDTLWGHLTIGGLVRDTNLNLSHIKTIYSNGLTSFVIDATTKVDCSVGKYGLNFTPNFDSVEQRITSVSVDINRVVSELTVYSYSLTDHDMVKVSDIGYGSSNSATVEFGFKELCVVHYTIWLHHYGWLYRGSYNPYKFDTVEVSYFHSGEGNSQNAIDAVLCKCNSADDVLNLRLMCNDCGELTCYYDNFDGTFVGSTTLLGFSEVTPSNYETQRSKLGRYHFMHKVFNYEYFFVSAHANTDLVVKLNYNVTNSDLRYGITGKTIEITINGNELYPDGSHRFTISYDGGGSPITVTFHSRPWTSLSGSMVENMKREAVNFVSQGQCLSLNTKYFICEIVNQGSDVGFAGRINLKPASTSFGWLFDEKGAIKYRFNEITNSFVNVNNSEEDVTDLIFSQMLLASFKTDEYNLTDDLYEYEAGDVQAARQLAISRLMFNVWSYMLKHESDNFINLWKDLLNYPVDSVLTPLALVSKLETDEFDHTFQGCETLYDEADLQKLDINNLGLASICHKQFCDGSEMSMDDQIQLLTPFIQYKCRNSEAFMQMYYAISGNFPSFNPYDHGNRLKYPKWHIATDKENEEYIDNVIAGAVIVVLAIIAMYYGIKITKFIKKRRLLKKYKIEAQIESGKLALSNSASLVRSNREKVNEITEKLQDSNLDTDTRAKLLEQLKLAKSDLKESIAKFNTDSNKMVTEHLSKRKLRKFISDNGLKDVSPNDDGSDSNFTDEDYENALNKQNELLLTEIESMVSSEDGNAVTSDDLANVSTAMNENHEALTNAIANVTPIVVNTMSEIKEAISVKLNEITDGNTADKQEAIDAFHRTED